jgi:hypothetical protein
MRRQDAALLRDRIEELLHETQASH